jgi:hypothetical protein
MRPPVNQNENPSEISSARFGRNIGAIRTLLRETVRHRSLCLVEPTRPPISSPVPPPAPLKASTHKSFPTSSSLLGWLWEQLPNPVNAPTAVPTANPIPMPASKWDFWPALTSNRPMEARLIANPATSMVSRVKRSRAPTALPCGTSGLVIRTRTPESGRTWSCTGGARTNTNSRRMIERWSLRGPPGDC